MKHTFHFITTSGTTVSITPTYSGHADNRDALQNSFTVSTSTGPPRNIDVIFPTPQIMEAALEVEAGISFESNREELAVLTVLSEIEQSPDIFAEPGSGEILADSSSVIKNLKRAKFSDREMRRYIVRRVYDHYSRTKLSEPVPIEKMDFCENWVGDVHK